MRMRMMPTAPRRPQRDLGCSLQNPHVPLERLGSPWVTVGGHPVSGLSGMGLFSLPWLPSWRSLVLGLPWERRSRGGKATSCRGQKRPGFAPAGGWGTG